MENNSREKEQKHSPEDLADLMEEIDRETSDITDLAIPEESIIDDMVFGGEEESIELDPALFDQDDLEMELETGEGLKGSSTIDTSVNDKGKAGEVLAKEEAVSSDSEEATAGGMSNGLASTVTNRIEEVVSRLIEERMSTTGKHSSKDSSKGAEEMPGLERAVDNNSEKPIFDPSTNELADLMSNRIERIVSRKLEEQMPAIAERILLELMKKILLSVK